MAIIAAGRRAAVAIVARGLLCEDSGRLVLELGNIKSRPIAVVSFMFELTIKAVTSSILVIHCGSSHLDWAWLLELEGTCRSKVGYDDKTACDGW
jgi:hypothetical protein